MPAGRQVRTRFAPSPTGDLHIGSLRTALYAYALAKHENGDFVLRIEDTDQKREIPGAVKKLKETLKIFGIGWDEYFVQSERVKTGMYKKAAEKLVEEGKAFYCQCSAKNAKEEGFSKELRDPCREKNLTHGAIKLRVPDGEKIGYKDFVLDKYIEWETSSVSDATLLKSDGFPTYHLAVVVDDTDMKISHVLRGHDWMPSTPIHLLVYRYLGLEVPKIGHLSDIQDPGGGKLSKRKGSVSCEAMIAEGYLPEAIFNFVILLGWAPKDDRELFTLDQFVESFDPRGFQKANPVFNRDKLDWFNGEYIRNLPLEDLNLKLKSQNAKFAELEISKQLAITTLVQDRIKKLSDFGALAGFFFERKKVNKKLFGKNYVEHLTKASAAIEKDLPLDKVPRDNGFKVGDFFMDLRIAITGSKFTPPINESTAILGKEETLARLRLAMTNF